MEIALIPQFSKPVRSAPALDYSDYRVGSRAKRNVAKPAIK